MSSGNNKETIFAVITSLKCGHCKKFRGSGKILHTEEPSETISIYSNNGRGWRWDQDFFISILLASSNTSSVIIYDIVFMDFAPKRYFNIFKYTIFKNGSDNDQRKTTSTSKTTTLRIAREEITDENIIGNIPPASIIENYIEKYPCFLFVNGDVWRHFSSLESWREYESLFANEETVYSKYRGSPMYAIAPITNTTPTVLKGYGPKGIFCFGYLEKYKDDFEVTQRIDIVEEFRKFSSLSPAEQVFPSESDQRLLPLRVPSYNSLAITEWTSSSKPYFIDATSHFDTQTFMYSSCEYRRR